MSDPSWLDAWPADAPDIQSHYERITPLQWPRGLYASTSEAVKDLTAFGTVLSWIRKMTWWILMRGYFPHQDSGGYLISWWEDLFKLPHTGTIAERQNRIIGACRMGGTATYAKIRAIFGPIFGTTAPESNITATAPSNAQVWRSCLSFDRLRWDAAQGIDFNAVSGASDSCVWAVGDGGVIYKWAPHVGYPTRMWSASISGTGSNLYGVFAPYGDPTFAWAVGAGGVIREWYSSAWGAGPVGGPSDPLMAVSGTARKRWSAAHSAWIPHTMAVAGGSGRLAFWDGSWTSSVQGGGANTWRGIHAYAPNDIWACDDAGNVANWDGSSWTVTAVDGSAFFYGIRKTVEGNVYAAGAAGVVYVWDGASWTDISPTTADHFYGLSGWSDDRLVTCTNTGQIWRYNGPEEDTWTTLDTGCWEALNGIWAAENTCVVYAVGENNQTCRSPKEEGEGFARGQNCLHVHSTGNNLTPDYPSGRGLAQLVQALQSFWTIGRRRTLRWSDSGGYSGWDNACWG